MRIKDLNCDGKIDKEDAELFSSTIKNTSQLVLACISIASIIIITLVLFSSVVDYEKIEKLKDLLEIFYVGNFSLVAAYMGLDSWMTMHSGRGC